MTVIITGKRRGVDVELVVSGQRIEGDIGVLLEAQRLVDHGITVGSPGLDVGPAELAGETYLTVATLVASLDELELVNGLRPLPPLPDGAIA